MIIMVLGGGVANLLIPITGLKHLHCQKDCISPPVANLLIPITGLKHILCRLYLKANIKVANLLIPITGLKHPSTNLSLSCIGSR